VRHAEGGRVPEGVFACAHVELVAQDAYPERLNDGCSGACRLGARLGAAYNHAGKVEVDMVKTINLPVELDYAYGYNELEVWHDYFGR
jgi:hypothetical protein